MHLYALTLQRASQATCSIHGNFTGTRQQVRNPLPWLGCFGMQALHCQTEVSVRVCYKRKKWPSTQPHHPRSVRLLDERVQLAHGSHR
jgi:hypothetical protein